MPTTPTTDTETPDVSPRPFRPVFQPQPDATFLTVEFKLPDSTETPVAHQPPAQRTTFRHGDDHVSYRDAHAYSSLEFLAQRVRYTVETPTVPGEYTVDLIYDEAIDQLAATGVSMDDAILSRFYFEVWDGDAAARVSSTGLDDFLHDTFDSTGMTIDQFAPDKPHLVTVRPDA